MRYKKQAEAVNEFLEKESQNHDLVPHEFDIIY
jgi:hypothetical protein